MPGPHTTLQPGQHQFPKNFIVSSGKMFGLGGAPGMVEGDLGWGWGRAWPITKIKGFYKKCYKLVSKENPREAGRGSREGGGKRARKGGTKTVNH